MDRDRPPEWGPLPGAAPTVRQEAAAEAARLMAEDGYRDWAAAKNKALQRLGHGRSAMPSNMEVADALKAHLQLFDAEETHDRLCERRRLAISLMRRLGQFQPRAAGALVSGIMTEHMPLEIHLFADPPERVDIFLSDAGWDFDDDERRMRHPDGRELDVPVCRLETPEGVQVEFVVFGEDSMRWSPASPIDGKPMTRLDLKAVQALLADNGC